MVVLCENLTNVDAFRPPAVVPPVADPSVCIVTWAFVSQINFKLKSAVIAWWGAAPSGSTSQDQSVNLVGEGFS